MREQTQTRGTANQRAGGRLKRLLAGRPGARLAFWSLFSLLLLGVLAPLLANEFPLLAFIHGRLRFPAWRAFDGYDLAWTGGGALCLAGFGISRLLGRWPFCHRWFLEAVVPLAGLGLLVAVVAWRPVNLAVTDFHGLEQEAGNWCLWAPLPHGWLDQEERSPSRLVAPGQYADHPLGTDSYGRDVLARLIYGTRVSLLVGVGAVGLALLVGIFLGALAGYLGGVVDLCLSWLTQVFMCFPVLFAVLVLQVFLPPSVLWVVLLLGLVRWTGTARLMRGEVMRLKGEGYVLAARVQGLPSSSIIVRHLIPNALAPVIVQATFGVAAAILVETALSFLGLGVPPPFPSWGEMLAQGQTAMQEAPLLVVLPGLAIFLTVLSFNLLGEGLRGALDPRGGFEEEL